MLAFPLGAVASTIDSAEAAITKNDIYTLRDALRFYYREYAQYPILSPRDILSVLTGVDVNGKNPKKIVFWEPRPEKKILWFTTKRGNVDKNGGLLDGWGRPIVVFTDATSNTISAWSTGPEGMRDREEADRRGFYWKLPK